MTKLRGVVLVDGHEYVNLRLAMAISGRSQSWVARQSMLGNIRTLLRPGESPKYLRADLEADSLVEAASA